MKFGVEKHLEAIKAGKLYFSCAKNYILIDKNGGNAEQGDIDEGVFARLKKSDSKIAQAELLLGKDLEIINDDSHVKLRRKSSLFCPVFCLYGLTVGELVEGRTHSGLQKVRTHIDDRLRKNFANAQSALLANENRPAFLFLQVSPFMKRYECVTKSQNIQCKSQKVDYSVKAAGEFYIDPTDDRPELFCKKPDHSYQHEVRVCIVDPRYRLKSVCDNYILEVVPFTDSDSHVSAAGIAYYDIEVDVGISK